MVDMNMGVLRGAMGSAAANRNFEPQRANNVLFFADLQGVPGVDVNVLTLALATCPIPKSSNGILEVGFLNGTRKFAGKVVYEDLNFSFIDYLDMNVARTLLAWRYLVHNPETEQNGLKAQYAKSGRIKLYAPDGSEDTVRVWNVFGMWPSAFDPGEGDMEGDAPIRCNVTLTIDKAIPGRNLNPLGGDGFPT